MILCYDLKNLHLPLKMLSIIAWMTNHLDYLTILSHLNHPSTPHHPISTSKSHSWSQINQKTDGWNILISPEKFVPLSVSFQFQHQNKIFARTIAKLSTNFIYFLDSLKISKKHQQMIGIQNKSFIEWSLVRILIRF